MTSDRQPKSLLQRFRAGVNCAVLGIACAMAFGVSSVGYVGMSDLPSSSTSSLWSALAVVFALLFWIVFVQKGLRAHAIHIVAGLLFGVVNYFGTTLFAYDTWSYLNGPLAWAKALLQCAGQGLPMVSVIVLVDAALRRGMLSRENGAPMRSFPRLRKFYREHTTLACMAVFVLCWLPYLVVYYPGSVSWDIGEMLAQFFGQREMDTWHPVFTTWLVGSFFWFGRLFSSDNMGAILFTLLQTTALAYALSCAVTCMRRMGANRWVQGVALCFFGLVPIWGSYAQFICKDTLYTAMLLLFALKTIEVLRGESVGSGWFFVQYFVCALLTCLLRSNGLYVVLPTAILVIIFAVCGKQDGRMGKVRVSAALGGAILCAFLFFNALTPALGIKDETSGGIYSVCFQQSARTLRDHPAEITPEEYEEIDLVLDAQSLPELYEPWISDPVKYTFKAYGQGAVVEKQALSRYQKVWFSMLLKYPVTYLEAFVAGNSAYYAFTPKMEGETYNNQAGNRFVFETHPQVATHLDVHTAYIPALEKPRVWLAAFARGWRHIPLLSLLYGCATYTWLLVAAGVSIARQRRWRELIAFAPALLSLATCMLSPVNDYFRYFLPIVAMALPLLMMANGGATPCDKCGNGGRRSTETIGK